MLKYIRKRKKVIYVTPLKATDVLYQKMHAYNNEAKTILKYLIELVQAENKSSPQLKALYQLMDKADEIVIDCAHKLAPYQSPKLESIEVRNKIEHKFVLRAPAKIVSMDEWAKQTGAEKLNSDQMNPQLKQLTPPAPSIHDFASDERLRISAERDEEDSIEDEIKTYRSVN